MAVTVDSTITRTVVGNKRVLVQQIDIGADADTYTPPGFSRIEFWHCRGAAETAIGGTNTDTVITFQTAGAELNAVLFVMGH